MKPVSMIASCIALSLSTGALAAETGVAQPTDAQPTKPAKDPNRVVCKTEAVSGSLIATQKTCLTAAQWKDRAYRAGQWVEHQSTYNSQPNGR